MPCARHLERGTGEPDRGLLCRHTAVRKTNHCLTESKRVPSVLSGWSRQYYQGRCEEDTLATVIRGPLGSRLGCVQICVVTLSWWLPRLMQQATGCVHSPSRGPKSFCTVSSMADPPGVPVPPHASPFPCQLADFQAKHLTPFCLKMLFGCFPTEQYQEASTAS